MSDLAQDQTPSIPRTISRIAARLGDDGAIGDRAALRRLSFETPDAPAFWRIVVSELQPMLPEASPYREEHERRWAAILGGLAEVAGAGLHVPKRRLGEAAAAAQLHEMRVLKLLRAHGDALLALVRPLAHQLVSKGVPVDWADVAELVLSDGRPHGDRVRRNLARSYFSAVSRQPTSQEP
ncbi:MAG: type I-E CRISPR-associated protein Cse2/CasB [Myxococcales bacterium]|nr:type I-E CRISPR-associated protein Cse2/CasB [Myxococcales bacterium]